MSVPRIGALCCAAFLLLATASLAQTQQTAPTTTQDTLPPPAHHAARPSPPGEPATRTPVHQPSGAARTPIVRPHGQVHAEPAKEATQASRSTRTKAGKPAGKPSVATQKPADQTLEAAIPLPPPKPPPIVDPNIGSVTGLKLPRFASLRADEVNMRAGPGTRYPIEWLYKRRGLPVEIEREFEVWRLVKDPDGVRGWVHEATLTGRRSFIVTGGERPLRRDSNEAAHAVAILKAGVTGRIRSCAAAAEWCRVQVGGYSGWLERRAFWGTLPAEAVSQ